MPESRRWLILPFVAAAASLAPAWQTQSSWPDLTTMNGCQACGSAVPGTEAAALNTLKNRFKPAKEGRPITVATLLREHPVKGESQIKSADPRNNQPLCLIGFVRNVVSGGSETANCKSKDPANCDVILELVDDLNRSDPTGKGMVVVEITPRSKVLVKLGLIRTNIGNNWSVEQVRTRTLGHKIRVYGWRFYDTAHHTESWAVDPADKLGARNWRGTCWEVHPVLGLEVLDAAGAE